MEEMGGIAENLPRTYPNRFFFNQQKPQKARNDPGAHETTMARTKQRAGAHEMAPGGSRNGLSRARPGSSPALRSGRMIFQSAESQPTRRSLWRRFFIDQAVAAA